MTQSLSFASAYEGFRSRLVALYGKPGQNEDKAKADHPKSAFVKMKVGNAMLELNFTKWFDEELSFLKTGEIAVRKEDVLRFSNLLTSQMRDIQTLKTEIEQADKDFTLTTEDVKEYYKQMRFLKPSIPEDLVAEPNSTRKQNIYPFSTQQENTALSVVEANRELQQSNGELLETVIRIAGTTQEYFSSVSALWYFYDIYLIEHQYLDSSEKKMKEFGDKFQPLTRDLKSKNISVNQVDGKIREAKELLGAWGLLKQTIQEKIESVEKAPIPEAEKLQLIKDEPLRIKVESAFITYVGGDWPGELARNITVLTKSATRLQEVISEIHEPLKNEEKPTLAGKPASNNEEKPVLAGKPASKDEVRLIPEESKEKEVKRSSSNGVKSVPEEPKQNNGEKPPSNHEAPPVTEEPLEKEKKKGLFGSFRSTKKNK